MDNLVKRKFVEVAIALATSRVGCSRSLTCSDGDDVINYHLFCLNWIYFTTYCVSDCSQVFQCKGLLLIGRLDAVPTSFSINGTLEDGGTMSAIYCPLLDDGENITCVIDYGDMAGSIWPVESYAAPVCTSYQYNTSDVYEVNTFCMVADKVFNDSLVITIAIPITGARVGNDRGGYTFYGNTFFAAEANVIFRFVFTMVTGTIVTINVTELDNNTNVFLQQNASAGELEYFDVLKSSPGYYVYEVTFSNLLSAFTQNVILKVEERILGFIWQLSSMYTLLTGSVNEIYFTLTSGSDVVVAVEANGVYLVDKCSGYLRSYNSTITLDNAGIYDATVRVSNSISQELYTISYNIQYPVNNITVNATKEVMLYSDTTEINFEMSSDALFPMGNLSAVIDFGGNISEIFLPLTNGSIISQPIGPLPAGLYPVHVFVNSELTSLNFTWTQVVENTVNSLEFLYSPVVMLSEGTPQIGVRITDPSVSPLYNLMCVFTIDGVNQQQTFNLTSGMDGNVTVQYSRNGNITISYNCSNMLTWQSDIGNVEVSSDCFKEATLFNTVYKDKTKAVILVTSKINSITGKVQVNPSCQNSSRDYWWDLKEVYANGSEISRKYYTFGENQPGSSVISFAKESIDIGLYSLHLAVNLTDIPGGYIKDYLYIKFIYPELVTGITGGAERVLSHNSALYLDAESQTVDLVETISDPYVYTWSCMKTNGSNAEISSTIARWYSGDKSVLVSVNIDCYSNVSAGKVTIPASELVTGNWYMYVVNVTRGVRSAEGIQAVYISNGVVPTINIRCSRNCLAKMSANTRLVLDAVCAECQEGKPSYSWEIQIYNDTIGEYQAIADTSSIVDSEITSSSLGIKANVLEEGLNYRMQLDVIRGNPYLPAYVTYQVKINQPPYNGQCSVNPVEGDAALTTFTILCENWMDEGFRAQRNPALDGNEFLIYKVLHVRNDTHTSIIAESQESLITSKIAVGDPAKDYEVDIVVRVTDALNGYTDNYFTIKVKNPLDNSTLTPTEISVEMNIFITTVMDEAERTNDAGIVVQTAETVISVLNLQVVTNKTVYTVVDQPSDWTSGLLDIKNDTAMSYADLMENLQKREWDRIQESVTQGIQNLTSKMKSYLQEGNTSTYTMVEMSASAFATAVSNNAFVGSESAIDASTALLMLGDSFTNLTESTLQNPIKSNVPEIETAAQALYNLASNLLASTIPSTLSNSFFGLTTDNIATSRDVVDFEMYMNGNTAYLRAENAEITPEERTALYRLRARISQYELSVKREVAKDTSRAVIDTVQSVAEQLLEATCRTCEDIFLTSNVDILLKIHNVSQMKNVQLKSTKVSLSVEEGTNIKMNVKMSVVAYTRNPYIYGNDPADASSITSLVHHVSAKDDNKKDINLDRITVKQQTEVILAGYFEPTFTEGDASKLFYHVLYYRKLEDSLCLHIVPSLPVSVLTYDVFVRQSDYPTHLTYDAKTLLSPERDWTACVEPGYLKSIGKTFIGLKPTPITTLNRRRKLLGINATEASLSAYNFTVATAACKSWDESKGLWDGSPCLMDWFPDENNIECSCKPSKEMTFANTFYVAPNRIDFSSVFLKFSPLNQAAVLGTLSAILVIYIILIIWARHQDKKDRVKWGVTPLVDNFVDDTYYYLLTVYTGMRRGAGTQSRIAFIVAGADGDTGIRELYDGVRREISTGSVMYFIMAVSEPLGELDYIYIWHDNSGDGSKASWYLNRIDIEDIQQKERTVFLCGRWLAVEENEGTCDAVLPACGNENLSTFENMFYTNAKDDLANSHLWVSIFYRPTCSWYTRVQRVSCAFVFILLTMIANAMYFSPEDDFENPHMIRVGAFVFSLQEIYISVICALISAPATLLVIFLFKKANPRCVDYDVKSSASKYTVPVFGQWMQSLMKDSKDLQKAMVAKGVWDVNETYLPFWCRYIAWILVAAGTIVPAFFVLLYSMQWGKQKSEMWLSRFFLSFFESAFLLDPLKVIIMAVVFSIIFKQRERFKPTGLDREIVLKNYRQKLSHQSKGFRVPAPPLSSGSIHKARKERKRDTKMYNSLKEVAVTMVFLWIVFSISYSNRDDRSYMLHQNIVNRMLYPREITWPKFTEITTTEQFVNWLNWTAFPVMFPEVEYNDDPLHWRWRQYFSDLNNYRVGPPRLRQLRVGKHERPLPGFGTVTYYPDYNVIEETTDDLCYSWKNKPCDLEKEAYSFSYGAWSFTSAADIWGVPVFGLYSTYGGGGYIAELDVNWSFSNRTLKELSEGFWFDRQTRAVFLEFVLYSPNMNIFTHCFFLAEFPDTGGVITLYSIYPLRVYQHHGPQGTYMIFCEIMFILFLVLLSVRVIRRLILFKCQYFKDAWRTLDFICIILGIIGISMYVGRLLLANETMANFANDPKSFVNFQHIAFWDLMFIVVLGSLVFLSTFRLLGILGYDKRIGKVFKVFSNCAWDLFWFGLLFTYLFITYATLGYLFFGRDLKSYSDLIESLSTLFISMIGKSRFSEMEESDPIMSKFYFLTFILFLVYFMLTMFLAILCDSINAVQKWTKADRSDELIDFLIDKFKQLLGFHKHGKRNRDLDFSSIQEGQVTYMSLLSDLRNTIYLEFENVPSVAVNNPPMPLKATTLQRQK